MLRALTSRGSQSAWRLSYALSAKSGRTLSSSTTNSGRGGSAVYETVKAVDEYLQFHYATDAELMPYSPEVAPTAALGFPKRCASLALAASGRERALDVGCSVGGMSFELARHFQSVVGVDFSQAFVDTASDMQQRGSRSYQSLIQAHITQERQAVVDAGIDRSRVAFEQGDACHLREDLGTFDAILAANLLCRLPDPILFLLRTGLMLRPGGVLVLISPYSWLEEWTPPANWLGGKPGGKQSAEVVDELLEAQGLELLERRDMPFLIREHERKFQWGCSDATIWRKSA